MSKIGFLTRITTAVITFIAPPIAATFGFDREEYVPQNYIESVSDESMLSLAVESFEGPWGTALQTFMNTTDNKVAGWEYIYGRTDGKEACSWALWQNKYQDTTYALAFAGLDSPFDFETFIPMMFSRNYSEQMRDALAALGEIKGRATTPVEKLYITGHSLGGYLAMFVGTEIVDAYNNDEMASIDFDETFGSNADNLSMDKNDPDIKIVTFGNPGFYKKAYKFPDALKPFLGDLAVHSFSDGSIRPASWALRKNTNNNLKIYDAYITVYVNTFDPVANLIVAPEDSEAFGHVGIVRKFHVNTPTVFESAVAWGLNVIDFNNAYHNSSYVAQHGPWVYMDMLKSLK